MAAVLSMGEGGLEVEPGTSAAVRLIALATLVAWLVDIGAGDELLELPQAASASAESRALAAMSERRRVMGNLPEAG